MRGSEWGTRRERRERGGRGGGLSRQPRGRRGQRALTLSLTQTNRGRSRIKDRKRKACWLLKCSGRRRKEMVRSGSNVGRREQGRRRNDGTTSQGRRSRGRGQTQRWQGKYGSRDAERGGGRGDSLSRKRRRHHRNVPNRTGRNGCRVCHHQGRHTLNGCG